MVEIEAIPDNDSQESENLEENVETNADGWRALMGEDLMMKVRRIRWTCLKVNLWFPLFTFLVLTIASLKTVIISQVIDTKTPSNGKEAEAVKPQDAVLIDFVGRLADNKLETDGNFFQNVKGWLVVVGDGDVLPALELAIRFMEAGQTARVWSNSKYALGPGTRLYQNTTVPPNSNVMYEVTVTQIVVDTSRLNPYFTIQKALTKKNIANDIYQCEFCAPPKKASDPNCASAMARAIRLYQKSAKEMDTLLQGTYFQQVEEDHPQRHQSRQLLLDCLNNIVAVYLKQQKYHQAKLAAVEVLKQDQKNLKALLRAGKAALLDPASTLEEVKAALKAAESEITYKNPQEEKELKKLKAQFKRNQHEYKEKRKEMFADKLKTNRLGDDDESISETNANKTFESEPGAEARSTENVCSDSIVEGTGAKTEDDIIFWKTQVLTIILQVGIPLMLFLLYRLVVKTNRVAGETMAASGNKPIVEEDRTTIGL